MITYREKLMVISAIHCSPASLFHGYEALRIVQLWELASEGRLDSFVSKKSVQHDIDSMWDSLMRYKPEGIFV